MPAILDPDFKGFEWDDAKALANRLKHGITFDEAAEALSHPHIERPSYKNEEARVLAICPQSERIIAVIYVMREAVCRIISARAARDDEKREYRSLFPE